MESIPQKTCPKCGIEKPLTAYYKDRKRNDGVQSWCKACCQASDAARKPKAAPRPESIRARMTREAAERRAEQAALKEQLRAEPMKVCPRCGHRKPKADYTVDSRYNDGRYPYCADCRREWREGRKDKQRELHRDWRERNQEHTRTYIREYFQNNEEQRQRNRTATDKRDRERYQNDPEYHQRKNTQAAEKNRRRRAALYGAPAEHHTEREWQQLCAIYDHRCLRCKRHLALTRDHVVPVTKQGSDAITNIQPLCGPCNSWKGNRTIDFRPGWDT